jgi:DUF4097 and DUF4098 domain-containing protein YvlB
MRRRSFTGPIILLGLGVLFLWSNLHPEFRVFDLAGRYWPFLLILWGVGRLIEVMLPNNNAFGSSFSGGEVLLIVLICLVGSGFYTASRYRIPLRGPFSDVFGTDFDYPISAKASAGSAKLIVVDLPRGNLKISGIDDTTDITVTGQKTINAYKHEDADRANGGTNIEVAVEGDHVIVRTNQDRASDVTSVADDLEITVPRGMAVQARGRHNDYEVSDVAGNVELASDRGDARLARVGGNVRLTISRSETLRAEDVKGNVDINGQGSGLELENIAGQVTITGGFTGSLDFKNLAKPLQFEGARDTELHAQAVPGHVTMDLSHFDGQGLTGPVRLVARSRDIKIADFSKSLELESAHGDVEIETGLPTPSIDVRADSGNIDLGLPEKATFDLEATAERGDGSNDFGAPIEQHQDGRQATLKGKVGSGPTVRIAVTHGSVSVHKRSETPGEPASPAPKNLKDSEVKL